MVLDVVMELPFYAQDQLRVLPLCTRPLLAGRSFFDFGVAGRFGPRVSAVWMARKRSDLVIASPLQNPSILGM